MASQEQCTIKPAWDKPQKMFFTSQACFRIYKLFEKVLWDSRNVKIAILMHSADKLSDFKTHLPVFNELNYSVKAQLFGYGEKQKEENNCDAEFHISECTALPVQVCTKEVRQGMPRGTSKLQCQSPRGLVLQGSSQQAPPAADSSFSISSIWSNRLRSQTQ